MSNSPTAWSFSSQDQLRYRYDERYDQLVYENGVRIARPPYVSREYLIAAGSQQFYEYDRRSINALNSTEARNSLTAPRTMSLYSSHANPHPEASSPTRAYRHTAGRAGGANMNMLSQASHGSGTYMTNTYGVQAFSGVSMPDSSPNEIVTDFQRSMAIGTTSKPPSYHPTVARVRRTSEGGNVMHMYDTTLAMQPSNQEIPETDKRLNPKFKRIGKSKKFFVTGKVFLTLWSEPAGDLSDSAQTVITEGISAGSFGEPVFSKIRRFVVVREGEQACAALPIVTYGHQGVSKKGVNKSEHAIIHTGKKIPAALPQELPERGERGLLPQPIRVDPDDPEQKLDPMSRVDFAKVYTIQHNVKVRSLGKVNRTSMQPLLYQFKTVWSKYFGDSAPELQTGTPYQAPAVPVEASASCSQSELIAAYNALRACGLTAEQARAPLLKAGLHISTAEFDEHNVEEDDKYEASDTDESGENTPEGSESAVGDLPKP